MKRTRVISFKIEPELKDKLRKLAEKEDRSISYVIHRALWDLVGAHPANKRR